jgi:hypothetical protein
MSLTLIPFDEAPEPTPRPCSTPHSAPVAWLKYDPGPLPPVEPACPEPDDTAPAPPELDAVAAHLRSNPEALAEFVASFTPEGTRGDGWTPFARKLFLQVLAETARVGFALLHVGLSRQSANALRHRDPLFAAGWDAAMFMARNVIADEYAEKGLDGIVETVTRNGEVIERRRFDTRLSIAVLNRLDKRCDRAEEKGSAHLAVMRNWDEWLDAMGKGDEAAARAILDSAPQCQSGQLPESANPTETRNPPGCDPWDNVWQAGSDDDPRPGRERGLPEGSWLTTFAPPPAFDGYENVKWDGWTWYERACTPEEVALIEEHQAALAAQEDAALIADAQAERESFFERLRADLGGHPGLEPGPAVTSAAADPAFVSPANAGIQLKE